MLLFGDKAIMFARRLRPLLVGMDWAADAEGDFILGLIGVGDHPTSVGAGIGFSIWVLDVHRFLLHRLVILEEYEGDKCPRQQ
ncbi:hypothetical protein [Roseovarius sp. THAF27]|uniref:hypothetical protein n=1 Tax=Roseovarius sp. THAF27 TaxID=2587850 RepID=UPI00156267DF|nr:hypothetical protein [Roseovarius sp. THAF27]